MAPVRKRRARNEGDRHAVVVAEAADMAVEVNGAREGLKEEAGDEHDKRKDDLDVGAVECRGVELAREYLHAVL